jgi:hypothetical protein
MKRHREAEVRKHVDVPPFYRFTVSYLANGFGRNWK